MQRALEWLGAYGVPVVLLSATLPHSVKTPLIAAYARGLHQTQVTAEVVPAAEQDYPVITIADRSNVTALTVPTPETKYRAAVEYLPDDAAALEQVMGQVHDDGGALLVLCNTVGRAQEAYSLAQELVRQDARLLHSRFIAADRIGSTWNANSRKPLAPFAFAVAFSHYLIIPSELIKSSQLPPRTAELS